MPLYTYVCDCCRIYTEELEDYNAPNAHRCTCGKGICFRTIGLPNAVCRGVENCKTIGQLAEENTRQLIEKHGRAAAEKIINDKTPKGKQLKLPEGGSLIERPKAIERPWWRDGSVQGTGPASDTPIDTTKIKNVEKYVATGDKG